MPWAARVTDPHVCPKIDPGPVPHVGGPILPDGAPTVFIAYMHAARVGDKATCTGSPAKILKGASTVQICGADAARMNDPTEHGGKILLGCPTVRIGNSPQGASFMGSGAPLVQQCEDPKAPLSV